MNIHKNARMTVHGRALLVEPHLRAGWRVADAAGSAGVSERTAYKWLGRFRGGRRGGAERPQIDAGALPAPPAGRAGRCDRAAAAASA